jgi:hypothetical protein
MSKPGLDHRHRNKDGEISGKQATPSFGCCAKFMGKALPPDIRKPQN